jgi:hypothetical protein
MSHFAGELRVYRYEQLRDGPHRGIVREAEDPAVFAELCGSIAP